MRGGITMLREIYIKNLVLIEELRMELQPGMNVFTGETGAGKSIIIDALGLLLGERMSSDLVRDAGQKAMVEGVFLLSEGEVKAFLEAEGLLDDEDEGQLIVRREISPQGRSSARINGRTVTVGQLKSLGEHLVDIHLQHDNQLLLNPRMYRYFVDTLVPEIEPVLQQVRRLYDRWQQSHQELEHILGREKERVQALDFLDYQIQEIEEVGLTPGEEEELVVQQQRMRDAEELRQGALEIHRLVYEAAQVGNHAAYDLVAAAVDRARALEKDAFFGPLAVSLENCLYELEDIGGKAADFASQLQFDAGELEEVESRLDVIARLKRKYGDTVEEILEFLEKARQEKSELADSELRAETLKAEVGELARLYREESARLTELRRQGGKVLTDLVHRELAQLGMPAVRFVVSVEPRETPGRDGRDQIMFLFSANPGEEPRLLSRVASGGEISRLILALKRALAEVYDVPTLIFDEIDVGVGGSALNAMARKLFELSCQHQVVLVTHSPQVASYSDCHYLLQKIMEDETTTTVVQRLGEEHKIEEIARMLAGKGYSRLSLEHAREMVSQAEDEKRKLGEDSIETLAKG